MNAVSSDNDGQGHGMDPRNMLYVHILEKLLYKFERKKKDHNCTTLYPKHKPPKGGETYKNIQILLL